MSSLLREADWAGYGSQNAVVALVLLDGGRRTYAKEEVLSLNRILCLLAENEGKQLGGSCGAASGFPGQRFSARADL